MFVAFLVRPIVQKILCPVRRVAPTIYFDNAIEAIAQALSRTALNAPVARRHLIKPGASDAPAKISIVEDTDVQGES
jgi:hypothetical protein